MDRCSMCGGEATTVVGYFAHRLGCPMLVATTASVPVLGYGIRKCRGHWHVTINGEDISFRLRSDKFASVEEALAVADKLTNGADPAEIVSAPSAPKAPTPEQDE